MLTFNDGERTVQDNGEEMNVPAAKTVLLDEPVGDTSVSLATVFSMPEKEEGIEEDLKSFNQGKQGTVNQ